MSGLAGHLARYEAALHAMQSGVAAMNGHAGGVATQCEPKHLRVGVNAAMSDQGGLVTLLIAKGVITLEEYQAAIADAMEREKASYEKALTALVGAAVTLA